MSLNYSLTGSHVTSSYWGRLFSIEDFLMKPQNEVHSTNKLLSQAGKCRFRDFLSNSDLSQFVLLLPLLEALLFPSCVPVARLTPSLYVFVSPSMKRDSNSAYLNMA